MKFAFLFYYRFSINVCDENKIVDGYFTVFYMGERAYMFR